MCMGRIIDREHARMHTRTHTRTHTTTLKVTLLEPLNVCDLYYGLLLFASIGKTRLHNETV